MAAFLANIGVNAAHAARSRLREDGSFAVLPIPEREPAPSPIRTLADPELRDLAALAPPSWRAKPVHLDPDFRSDPPTYGDSCRTAARAFNLRRAVPGDVIWFAARLHRPDGQAGLHLVARLEIEDVLADVVGDPGPGWWDRNAHVLRGRATGAWNSFWVFRGTPGRGWLEHAPALTRETLEHLFGRWSWPASASEQQVIAWHTRAVRRIA